MSGCICGQAGSQFCESCNYPCSSNPNSSNYHSGNITYEDSIVPEDFYVKNNIEHLKGTKAPDIPIIENIEEEIKSTIREIWDNFDKG